MRDLQQKIAKFCQKHDLNAQLEHRVLDLVSEVGEVAKEVLTETEYGKTGPATGSQALSEELGDALFALLDVANQAGVDLEISLERALNKYEARLKKGGASSDHD